MDSNIFLHNYQTTKENRNLLNGHKSPVIWFTGLSGSGKSSIANFVQNKLVNIKVQTYVLDGDNFRIGLNKDLGFSIEDRRKNIERVTHVAKLFSESGVLTIAAFISPTIEIREMAKKIIGEENFIEVFIDSSIDICESRDTKGLYKKARNGEIKDFTGINSPYEIPENPSLILDSGNRSIEECANQLIDFLYEKNIIENIKFQNKEWFYKNHGGNSTPTKNKQHAVFIGRYQPYHLGHINLIKQKLSLGIPVIIMVRDIEPDEKNPFTTEQTISMIKNYHNSQNEDVQVIAIPDIESINWGRGVGYELNEFFTPEDIKFISATKIRNSIKNNSNEWKSLIHESIQDEIINYLSN